MVQISGSPVHSCARELVRLVEYLRVHSCALKGVHEVGGTPAFTARACTKDSLAHASGCEDATRVHVDSSGFLDVNSVPPLYDPGTGQVVLTYDDAPPVSILGQAVDSTLLWVPMGVIDTGDVFFDLQIGVIGTL